MASEPITCNVCGALITDERGGELMRMPGEDDLVWVHPACRGKAIPVYVPRSDSRFAFLSLDDPVKVDSEGWVRLTDIEAQRGRWQGSDDADFMAGLDELIEQGWAESNDSGDAFLMTGQGSVLRSRLGLT